MSNANNTYYPYGGGGGYCSLCGMYYQGYSHVCTGSAWSVTWPLKPKDPEIEKLEKRVLELEQKVALEEERRRNVKRKRELEKKIADLEKKLKEIDNG